MRCVILMLIYSGVAGYWIHAGVPIIFFGLAAALGITKIQSLGRIKRSIIWFYFLVFFYATIALIVSLSTLKILNTDSVETFLRVTLTPVVVVTAFFVTPINTAEGVRILRILGASSVIAGLLMYFQSGPWELSFTIDGLIGRNRKDGYWLIDTFFQGAPSISGPLGLGGTLCLVFAMTEKGFTRVTMACLSLIAVTLLVLSLSRGGSVAMLGGVICGFIAMLAVSKKNQSHIGNFVVIGAVTTIGWIAYNLAIEHIPGAQIRFAVIQSGLAQDASMQERFEIWGLSIHAIFSNPFGFGFMYAREGLFSGYSAHNEILGQLIAVGSLGCLTILIIFGNAFFRVASLFKHASSERHVLQFLVAWIAGFVFFMLIGATENYSVSSPRLLFPTAWILIGLSCVRANGTYFSHLVGNNRVS